MKIHFTIVLLCAMTFVTAQNKPILIEEDIQRNRLQLYAINQNEVAYDILLTVEGSGIRQSKGTPRWVHVPAASKVQVKSLIIERGETPNCTYNVQANDSLSKRALKKPAVAIKIPLSQALTVYLPDGCSSCDSIISGLETSIYQYEKRKWEEETKLKEYLTKVYANTKTPLTGLTNPVIQLGGTYFTDIETYEQLLEKIKSLN